MSPRAARLIATAFGLGRVPLSPGTAASAATIPLAWGLHWLGGFPLFALALVVVVAIGWRATGIHLRGTDDPDPSEVVIDEVAGQLVALIPLSLGLWLAGAAPQVFPWPGWLGAFLMFRLFDIWKPGPVGAAERLHGARGVMADDLVAGAIAALLVTAAAAIAHGWLA